MDEFPKKKKCKKTHFSTARDASKHNAKHHFGKSEILVCPCGKGMYLENGTPVPAPVKPLPHVQSMSTCYRKKRYSTESFANKVISQRAFDGRSYACYVCGGWHITKTELRKK